MRWHLFIDKATGDLVSESATVPASLNTARVDVLDVDERPDWSAQRWDASTRTCVDIPHCPTCTCFDH
jgi:hypothetical protein